MTAPRRQATRSLPLVPAVVLLVVFFAGPVIWCVYAAFTNAALTGEGADNTKFIGVRNFDHLFHDSKFFNSVVLTVVFTLISAIIGQNILGMGLALLMRRANGVVRTVVGSVVVAAWVLPEIVAAFLWYAFLNPNGTVDSVLHTIGLPQQHWLYSSPIIAVSVANIWRGTAFSMLVYSAALSEVPTDLEEAAEMDGASGWRRLWNVTLPLITRSILTNLMLITLQTLSVFALVFAMTRGGPGTKSQTLPLYMYEQAFQFSNIGLGAAAALMLLAVGALFSVIYLRVLRVDA